MLNAQNTFQPGPDDVPVMVIELPWPGVALSPNTRTHWAALARAKKDYRAACKLATLNMMFYMGWDKKNRPDLQRISLDLNFRAPSRRAYDLDNMLARMKSGIDGVAEAFCVDDAGWNFLISRGEPAPPEGLVVVSVFLPVQDAQGAV